jgi:glyoxylase-like metal-dependent hydrolase (beta-lactamase superfamily II)
MREASAATTARRDVLTGLGAALAAPLLPGAGAHAAIAPVTRKVGAIEIVALSDGVLNVPLSLTLPDTPPADSAALFTAHGLPATGAPAPTNVTLVKTGGEIVLIDAGAGLNFQATAGKLAENMEAAGIDLAAITKVVFTHGHPDHLWGAIDEFDELRFPNASYVIPSVEWDYWTDPNTPNTGPDWRRGLARGSARILKRLNGKIERRRDGDGVAPGLSYAESAGHTPGHMSILVESAGARLVIGSDVLTHVAISFARPDWRIGTDHDSDHAIATRRRWLDRLATERLPLIGFHLPWPGYGMVERRGTAYRFVPV